MYTFFETSCTKDLFHNDVKGEKTLNALSQGSILTAIRDANRCLAIQISFNTSAVRIVAKNCGTLNVILCSIYRPQ